ncbi:hypothetical protein BOX15_Mlig026779g1 [Macrostomum lignano]|uniref:Uncharacterized protein n=1 Tax=Macrostomum lignano TaxID=282301 RepID=A0A267GTA6_9PLAT|nr:hypothetical protein BOX15_Mlig026779g1 [Macrostomum lignano]
MPKLRSIVSAVAASDAAAVKAAVVATTSGKIGGSKSKLEKMHQRLIKNRRLAKGYFFSIAAQASIDECPLWMNRKSKSKKSRHRSNAAVGTTAQRPSSSRNHSISSCKRSIPLAANNSATTKAKTASAEASEQAVVAAASGTDAELSQPTSGAVVGQPDDDSPESVEEENNVAGNAAMLRTSAVYDRMRQKLQRPPMRVLRQASLEASMNLVKLHRHPAQLLRATRQLEAVGTSQMEQILAHRRQSQYLAKAKASRLKKKKKNADEDQQSSAAAPTEGELPHWITFQLRFRRRNAETIWNDFVVHRKGMEKQLGDKGLSAVKNTERYNENFIDLWTHSLSVQSRPFGLLKDLLRPVFTRLGLDSRADLRVTIGCFANDTRQGGQRTKGVPKTPVPVSMLTPVIELYEAGITELFVSPWPGFRNGFPERYFDPQLMPKAGQSAATKPANTSNKNGSLISRFLRESQLAAARCEQLRNNSDSTLETIVSESD